MNETLLFHDMFDFLARSRPDQLCIDDGTRVLRFGEAADEVNRIANGLLALDLGKGDRFGYLSQNCADMWLMYLAAARTGAVPVPLNYRLAPAEWRYILTDAEAKALFIGSGYDAAIASIADELPGISHYLSFDASWDRARGCRDWLAEQSAAPVTCEIASDDIFYQMYTSGTTGLPKGVIVTHANYAANLAQAANMITRLPDAGDTALVVTPLYHAAAVWIAALCTARGMAIILKTEFDPADVVDTLDRERVAFTFLVPAMIQACLTQVPDIAERDWSALKLLMYGASPIAEDVLRRTVGLFGCDVYQAYGLTETTAILTLLGADEHRRALSGEAHLLLAAGRPLPGTDLRIADEDDAPLGEGRIGQILARGPQIVPGYWKLDEATAGFREGGWAHTGDAGEVDAEGYLYIRDRIKDMVVSGGENIYPREVENVLFDHPRIVDAAVIGVPDQKYGEALLALVVTDDGADIDADEVIAFCRTRLGGYKVPRRIERTDALPRNASGKVLKTELRKPYWEKAGRSVG
ncbi:long-chain-fatty-acid--CoA ligase [Parasphingopyxis algicola]|uniref:long-chain-fatty-acid--CoA ligase n=1 Tax=Parasphingopyxis algicola TaxID=2026624 RepID=UPI0015A48534|nr:long-chain-fatty-acid--CoA ligase [Parasphingopyxis algicola]QLC26467.1 long-chain-fatty-acid--CoA ligase [Parasphingopyxis algicola]